jgi:hypothetical protein
LNPSRTSDEEFDVVVEKDEGVAFGEIRLNVGLFQPVADIELVSVPEHGGPRVVDST